MTQTLIAPLTILLGFSALATLGQGDYLVAYVLFALACVGVFLIALIDMEYFKSN